MPPNNLYSFVAAFLLIIAGATMSPADDAFEMMRNAGVDKTIGTAPEDAFDGGELAYPALRGNPYWMIKHTFVKTTKAWNADHADIRGPHSVHPSQISDDLRNIVLNTYLHNANELWPQLDSEHGYTSDQVSILKRILVYGDHEDETPSEERPNAYLAKAIREFYNDWLTTEQENPRSLFARLTEGRLIDRGAQPLLSFTPTDARFDVDIHDDTGKPLPNARVTLTNVKASFFGSHAQTTIFTIPSVYILPCSTYQVKVELDGYQTETETITFKDCEPVKRDFILKTVTSALKTPTTGRIEVEHLHEVSVLEEFYRKLEGQLGVIEFPVAAWLAKLEKTPKIFGTLAPTLRGLVPGIGILTTSARTTVADGTNGAPSPAYNRSCLNVSIDFAELDSVLKNTGASEDEYENDVARAIVTWANLCRVNTTFPFEPLGAFTVQGHFYAKLEYRAQAETMEGHETLYPPYAVVLVHGPTLAERQPYWDYVRWNAQSYDHFLQLLNSKVRDQSLAVNPVHLFQADIGRQRLPGPRDDRVDLIIRFVKDFTVKAPAQSVGLFYNSGTDQQGTIEILVDDQKPPLPTGEVKPNNPRGYRSFLRIVLHEVGHYFGLRHLYRPLNLDEPVLSQFLNASAMAAGYGQTDDVPSPLDVWLLNQTIPMSLDINGRVCDGLIDKD